MRLVDEFLTTINVENTKKTYAQALNSWDKFCQENSLDYITAPTKEIRRVMRSWLTSLNIGESSQKLRIASIQSFYRWLINEEWRDSSPVESIKPMRQDAPKVRQYPTDNIVSKIIGWVTNEGNNRQRLVVRVLAESGLRVSELVALRKRDISLDGIVFVRTAKRNKTRRTAVRKETASLIHDVVVKDDDFVFQSPHNNKQNTPIDVSCINHLLASIASHAGCSEEEIRIASSPHAWRHYWTTKHVQNNTNTQVLQAMGGWSNPQMIRYYIDASQLTPIAIGE